MRPIARNRLPSWDEGKHDSKSIGLLRLRRALRRRPNSRLWQQRENGYGRAQRNRRLVGPQCRPRRRRWGDVPSGRRIVRRKCGLLQRQLRCRSRDLRELRQRVQSTGKCLLAPARLLYLRLQQWNVRRQPFGSGAGVAPFVCGGVCADLGGACSTSADCCPGLPCVATPGSARGTCGDRPTSDGGAADGSTPDPIQPDAGGSCAEYGQVCTAGADCCNGVPCSAGRCVYIVR